MGLSYYLDKIKNLLKNKKIIGHTLDVDIKALGLENIDANLRDISEFSLFKRGKYKESLKNLTDKYLQLNIQGGSHSSVEDARAALELYKLYEKEIEREIKDKTHMVEKRHKKIEKLN